MRLIAIFVALAALVPVGCKSNPSQAEKGQQSVALFKEGVQQFNENHIDAGIQTLRKGFEMQPTYSLLRQDLARMLLVRASRADDSSIKTLEEAKDLASENKQEEANRKKQESYDAHRAALKDFEEARDHLVYCLNAMPYEANIPYWLSQCEAGLGHYKEARKYLQQAIEAANPSGGELDRLQRAMELLQQAELQQQRLQKK